VRRKEANVPIRIQPVSPRNRRLQMVPRPRHARRNELIAAVRSCHDARAALLHQRLDVARPVQPLADVGALVPAAGPHGALRARRVQVRLVAVFPRIQLAALQGPAGQGRRLRQRVPARGRDAQGQVEAVRVLDPRPGAVAVKVGGADAHRRRVVRRLARVVRPVDGHGQGGVVEGVVLGVAAHADVGLGPDEVPNVGEEVVRERVGLR
jgi:hypothetical protein